MSYLTRRRFVAASGAASALLASNLRSAFAEAGISVRFASLQPGFAALQVQYILANKLGQKNGITIPNPTSYTTVSTYYNDFVVGNYDVCIGSWDTFAARYQAGVPIKYLCTITDANMIALVAPKGGVSDVSQLRGKTVAALQSTGTYRMVRALIKETANIDIEKDATIQNVDNPAASITLVMADRAHAGLSWEPSIAAGLVKRPDMRVIFRAGDAYHKVGEGDLPYFGVSVRQELLDKNPGVAARIAKIIEDCLAGIDADTATAIDLFGDKAGVPADILKEALASKRLVYNYRPMSDAASRKSVIEASKFLARNALLAKPIDDNFFAV